ncbi:MAG: helix-turn-helix domain-containing protein [Firmicutes bacterium]|nr:helix-turn-helix domain-containing protein [Bacillota bacterium]
MNLFEYVGKQIRQLREAYANGQGISQEALAKALGVAANTISRWETATHRPNLQDLDKLARFFGVSILEFFPPDDTAADDRLTALLRTAKQLPPEDLEELRRYAEFRKARYLYSQGVRPRPGRKRKEAK